MENVLSEAVYRKARTSVKKVAPVLDLVRGKPIRDAKIILAVDQSKASKLVLKVLKSAESNAENKKIETSGLFVSTIWASPGPTTKTGRFVGRGHFSPILKRSCHIYVGLNERSNK